MMDTALALENQLLATKFFVPVAPGPLISRPRLMALLAQSLHYPLTLVSAPAGFGKTTLLASWAHSLEASHSRLAWVSLDEDDNDPWLFWSYLLTALNRQQPGRFEPLLTYLQSQPSPSLNLLKALLNLLADNTEDVVLILDDYYLITEEQVYTTLSYLIEHLPARLHIILATRTDPPLPFPGLRARRQVLEVRTEQLRCTMEETGAFFREVMGIQLPQETIQEIATRIEGWLVGLQLLGLSLPEWSDPLTLLQATSGDQHYILDYLTEEVLRQQPQEVQTFLLCTSLLERFTAPLCNAVMEQVNSQQMLRQLEQANLFVVSLDSKREWYRYHRLFAQALRYHLERTSVDLVPVLHYRASRWYAQHNQITQAILHAFDAKEWQWAADLIERSPSLLSLSWGAGEGELAQLRRWFERLPADIITSRPQLCLVSAQMNWTAAGQLTMIISRLDAAEIMLIRQLQEDGPDLIPEMKRKQENLLGEVIGWRTSLQAFELDGQVVLSQCQKAFSLLAPDNFSSRASIAYTQLLAYYYDTNDTVAAIQSGLQASALSQAGSNTSQSIMIKALTTKCMIHAGQLHTAEQLIQETLQQGSQLRELVLPETGYLALFQAEILRERNQLDTALSMAQEAMALYQQVETIISPVFLFYGHAMLLRMALSRGELDVARSALEQIECMSMAMNQTTYLFLRSAFTTVDQVRLWLACGELDRARHWAQELKIGERLGTPFERERQEVARVRILLANKQPDLALQRLEPVLQRGVSGQRWSHVIEMRLLQALAYKMCLQVPQALSTLSEAMQLAEPEGYIRIFVDEGPPMAALLSRLHQEQRKGGPISYVDILLAAFPQQSKMGVHPSKRAAEPTQAQPLLVPLSGREREVLHLLVLGASNQEIAQDLVIALDTVKRHVSHIFSKLGVQNRVQAIRQAQALGLLGEET